MFSITGTLIWYFNICKREVWFMSRELNPDQDNSFLEFGRVIEENFYKRANKFYNFKNMKIDLIKKSGKYLLIGEIKKSSKYEKSSILQLAFYLKKLKELGVESKGELLIPKERKVIKVELNEQLEKEIDKAIEEIEKIIILDKPPELQKNRFCKRCAFREFCWS
ncbi:MAG: CRISPR-associated protein Cas4 [Caldisericia bacterium]|nr:CRISPR-associated protein Cas4 [Caldisericia bacterium]